MELVALPSRPSDWDQQIAAFDTKSLFHESAWLDFILSGSRNTQANYFRIQDRGKPAGYFCAFEKTRAKFRLYESPLAGRGIHLGPIVNTSIDTDELAQAIVQLCQERGVAYLELCSEILKPEAMEKLGFEVHASVNHSCPLHGGRESVWERMKGTCRTRIRKAQKMGLHAEATDNPDIADHFYGLFSKVLAQRGLKPAYGPDMVRRMLEHLLPADRLFPIWVKREGKIIGVGFYPHDERALYFWDGASDPDCLDLAPNELLHWTAIQLAAERGIPVFHMGGAPVPSRFTTKFGGEGRPYVLYRKSLSPWFVRARQIYSWFFGWASRAKAATSDMAASW